MNKLALVLEAFRKSIPTFNTIINQNPNPEPRITNKKIWFKWRREDIDIRVAAHYEIKYTDLYSKLLNELIVKELKQQITEEQWPELYRDIQFSFLTEAANLRGIQIVWDFDGEILGEYVKLNCLIPVYDGPTPTKKIAKWRF